MELAISPRALWVTVLGIFVGQVIVLEECARPAPCIFAGSNLTSENNPLSRRFPDTLHFITGTDRARVLTGGLRPFSRNFPDGPEAHPYEGNHPRSRRSPDLARGKPRGGTACRAATIRTSDCAGVYVPIHFVAGTGRAQDLTARSPIIFADGPETHPHKGSFRRPGCVFQPGSIFLPTPFIQP